MNATKRQDFFSVTLYKMSFENLCAVCGAETREPRYFKINSRSEFFSTEGKLCAECCAALAEKLLNPRVEDLALDGGKRGKEKHQEDET